MRVYFVSGLGADARVFKHIQLPDGVEAVYLEWLEPQMGESLSEYAGRMADRVDTQVPFVLAGLSMGGMVVQEMARFVQPERILLFSSVRHPAELPAYLRWAGKVRVHQFIPISWLKAGSLVKRLFTTETAEDKALMRAVVADGDPRFIRWAMTAILQWQSPPQSDVPVHHIHGRKDIVLPLRYTHPDAILPDAGHMLVLTHADPVNAWIRTQLVSK
jgi:pimeloyl-ACP methyl ester carboxylesterase